MKSLSSLVSSCVSVHAKGAMMTIGRRNADVFFNAPNFDIIFVTLKSNLLLNPYKVVITKPIKSNKQGVPDVYADIDTQMGVVLTHVYIYIFNISIYL